MDEGIFLLPNYQHNSFNHYKFSQATINRECNKEYNDSQFTDNYVATTVSAEAIKINSSNYHFILYRLYNKSMNNPHYIDIGQHPNDVVKSLCVYLLIDTLIFGFLCVIGIKLGLNYATFFIVASICIVFVGIFLQYSHKKRLVISEMAIFLIENKKDCIYKRILRWSDIKYIGSLVSN